MSIRENNDPVNGNRTDEERINEEAARCGVHPSRVKMAGSGTAGRPVFVITRTEDVDPMTPLAVISSGFEDVDEEMEAGRAKRLVQDAEGEAERAAIRKEPDIVKRAQRLRAKQAINFKDVKKVRSGDMMVTQAVMTDQNKEVVLTALFDGEKAAPHRDLFRGRIVDHDGMANGQMKGRIIDDHYPVSRWVDAFAAAGLNGVSWKGAREALKEWALSKERNDLIEYVGTCIPKHDGTDRMESKLIDLFKCRNTELNREFSKYFFLSLYNRVMVPGSEAPMVLSLFGAQGCGKSLFSKLICRIITGNPEADSVQLNLAGDRLDFLRNITGQSIIASVGEMVGFSRGDLDKIKDFITRSSDMMHYKFEGTFTQQRQWCTVLDGNDYTGLMRDPSGNRRFYPMFCGQLPDEMGKPQWQNDFVADFTGFEEDLWQMMAEAAKWMDDNGEEGYIEFIKGLIRKVSVFSADQVMKEAGVVEDELVSPYIDEALIKCNMYQTKEALWIDRKDIVAALIEVSDRSNLADARGFSQSLLKAMKSRGSDGKSARNIKVDGLKSTAPSYIFKGFSDAKALREFWANRLGGGNEEEATLIKSAASAALSAPLKAGENGITVADITNARARRKVASGDEHKF